jgi:drug/metabolite transporter (DMT)-like permease
VSYEYLALLAAACWATGSLLSAPAAVHLGAFSFTRWRMFLAATVLWSMVLFTGSWQTLDLANAGLLVLSGLIGIFVGDTALFASMNRLGPRRAGVLFATHSLFSVVLAWFWLGETLWGFTLIGSSMLISGVMIAVFFGKRNSEQHQWESNQGNLTTGVILGLLAALCQAVATLMLKPLMETDIDAIAASAVRMTAAFTAHFCLLAAGLKVARSYQPVNKRIFTLVLVNTLLSMVLGMTLILQALKYGDAGMVAVLSSVSPVIILPLLWMVYKKSPAAGAWAGALLTVTGTVLILLS